jgi:hypothetical protein
LSAASSGLDAFDARNTPLRALVRASMTFPTSSAAAAAVTAPTTLCVMSRGRLEELSRNKSVPFITNLSKQCVLGAAWTSISAAAENSNGSYWLPQFTTKARTSTSSATSGLEIVYEDSFALPGSANGWYVLHSSCLIHSATVV